MTSVAYQFVAWLATRGCDHAFVVPGADINPVVSAFRSSQRIRLIPVTDEFLAVSMAEGYARRSGRPAAAISGGGPGAASLAAAAAQVGDTPLLLLTGSAAPRRGFAETWAGDDCAMFAGAGCLSVALTREQDWGSALHQVASTLADGRPVHLAFDMDLQQLVPASESPPDHCPDQHPEEAPSATLGPRPLVAIGSLALEAAADLVAQLTRSGLPLVTDVDARGALTEDHPLALGHLGYMPAPAAVAALSQNHPLAATGVLALGTNTAFLRRLRHGGLPVFPVKLDQARTSLGSLAKPEPMWSAKLATFAMRNRPAPVGAAECLGHGDIVEEVAAAFVREVVVAIDAGTFHQSASSRWVARQPRTVLATETLTSMGWSIGAAIGAAFAGTSPVVALLGDGCLLMRPVGLALAATYRLPITFVVAENGVYASVRVRHPPGPKDPGALPNVDLLALAQACAVPSVRVRNRTELRTALQTRRDSSGPQLIVATLGRGDPDIDLRPTGIPWLSVTR